MTESDTTKSQTLAAFLGLRGLIVDGTLAPGARVSEPLIVERFGVSRTPARAALAQLAEEGLLAKREKSGYEVKSYTEKDVFQAIEIRGILEGMAARLAADRDVPAATLQKMDSVVLELDDVFHRPVISLDLPLSLRMVRSAACVAHFSLFQIFPQFAGDVRRSIVAQ